METAPRRRRSVFGNYSPSASASELQPCEHTPAAGQLDAGTDNTVGTALKRSFMHQFLARAFDYPDVHTWAWLSAASTRDGLAAAVDALELHQHGPLHVAKEAFVHAALSRRFEEFSDDYALAIGHAARGSCPINEIEYGDIKADPLFQPHRLADLAAFYRAFGLELCPESGERHDHLSIELEFMSVLAAQEATLLNTRPGDDAVTLSRDAQRKFLREHLGRWTPAFIRRLQRMAEERPLGLLARFALAFLEFEAARLKVALGSAELWLRPADEAASLCDSCGLSQSLPGAPAPLPNETPLR
jgi:DMSO reductase family type II enzyme chaperone